MTLYVIGDSHVKAMRIAFEQAPLNFNAPQDGLVIGLNLLPHPVALTPFFSQSTEEVSFNERLIAKRLKNITGATSFQAGDPNHYAICMPYTTTVWLRFDQWRNFRPWRTCDDLHQPLSDQVISEMARAHFRYLIDFIFALKNIGLKLVVIEAPPPRSDDRAAGLGGKTLLELDRLARDTISAALQDIPVIKPPAETYDEFGFLRQCYREPTDRHHANYEYGSMMLGEVLSRVRETFPTLKWQPNSQQTRVGCEPMSHIENSEVGSESEKAA